MKSGIILICMLFVSMTGIYAEGFQLVLSDSLQMNHDAYSVKGRNGILIKQKLTFGGYKTPCVKRSLIKKWSGQSGWLDVVWMEHMGGKQSIKFSLTNETDTAEALAVTNVADKNLIIGSNRNALPNIVIDLMNTGTAGQINNLNVAIKSSSMDTPWELFLDNTAAELRRKEPAGYLQNGEHYYTIQPVWQVERKGKIGNLPFGAAGLEFVNEDGVGVAAVSLMNEGVIYLGKLPETERLVLATAASAILLQSVID